MRARYLFLLSTVLVGAAAGLWACSFGPPVYNGPAPPPAPIEAGDDGDDGSGDDGSGNDGCSGDSTCSGDDGSTGDDGSSTDDGSSDDGGGQG